MGEFHSGSWCRFCKGKAVCRARAENYTALEDFKDFDIEGKLSEADVLAREDAICLGAEVPGVLSDAEIGDLLIRGAELVQWYGDLKSYALGAILDGKEIPGWKAVEGKSERAFTDENAAIQKLKDSGYEEEKLYKPKEALSLSNLEKLVGKKKFAELVGEFITKPHGKPTLASENDKRAAYSPASVDFAEVTADGTKAAES